MILARRPRRRLLARASIVAALLVGSAGCSSSAGIRIGLTPPPPSAAARSLPARWWSWVESVPAERNPVDDPTGADCALEQPSDVWFLAGTHGGAATRSCTIPADRPIYFPVINRICTVPSGVTSAQALSSCTAPVDSATASLDGKPLVAKEETSGGIFTFVARMRSSTGFSPGRHRAVAWGLWVGPIDLSPGKHIVRLSGQIGSFTTTVRYRLSVVAAG